MSSISDAWPVSIQRKLVAIVIADIVGYSRLMERDESGTHLRLLALRSEVVDPALTTHIGRVVSTAGDSFLAEFLSATSAVRFTVEIQREMAARNRDVAPDMKMQFRMGINLGEVIVDGHDIIGDDVNVAARLEVLAEPGGVCVAASIREQIRDDLGVAFVDAGLQQIKNIAKPVRMYRVALDGSGNASGGGAPPRTLGSVQTRTRRRARTLWTLGIAGAAAAGVVAWVFLQHLPQEAPMAAAALQASRLLVVLPFAAPKEDAALRTVADNLTAEITRAIADAQGGGVIAPNIAALLRNKAVDEVALGRELNVRYVLEGELHADGDDVAVTARVVDTTSGTLVGSNRLAVRRADLEREQPRLVNRLSYEVQNIVSSADARRTNAKPMAAMTVQELTDRALLLSASEDRAKLREGRRFADEAIRRDPSAARAYTARTVVTFSDFLVDFTADGARQLGDMDRDSLRATVLDDRDPQTWMARAFALQAQSRHLAALDALDRAQALDPSHHWTLRGFVLIHAGKSQEALKMIAERNALLGNGVHENLAVVSCYANVLLGNFRGAMGECQRSVNNDTYWAYLGLAAAAAETGDAAGAKAASDELIRRVPTLTLARLRAWNFSTNPVWREQVDSRLIPALRKAGVPE